MSKFSSLGRRAMHQRDGPGRLFRFGPFVADLETGELCKDGAKLALQVQPFQVLAILLRNSGELVTREQLRSQIWPKDTFVDFDHALNTAVTKVRVALGDNSEQPRFIETLPRRGYRFIAPVQKQSTANAASKDRGKRNPWIWIGTTLAGIALMSAIPMLLQFRKPQATLPSVEMVPLLALHGAQGQPAFSPDGNQVAFGEYEGEDGAIYTALIGSDKPLRLTVKPGVCCPTWSPDNRQIAFIRFLKEGTSINVISALGGNERTLYTQNHGNDYCHQLDWSPDGKWLAFGESSETVHSRISVLSLDDLSIRVLTTPPEQSYDCAAAFAHDGLRLAFERGSIGGLGRDLFVLSVKGGEPHRLTFDNAWGGSLAWTQDGTEIVFPSTRGGLLNLWRISANGGSPRPIAGIGPLSFAPSIPRKGNLLAYEHANLKNSIWRITLKDEKHPVGRATRLISAQGILNWRPDFSPDGKKIVFESDRLGYSDIWYCDSDGSNCEQLTSLHGTAGTARWSPDGKRIVFECQSQNYYNVYVLEVPDGRPRLVTTFPGADNGAPNWSRDGQWIYFYAVHEKGSFELWKVAFTGGTPVRVTKNGGVYAIESYDKRFLYFAKIGQPGIWKMPLNGGEEDRILQQPDSWADWAVSRNGIYFLDHTNGDTARIEFFDFATRQNIPIGDVENPTRGLALSPDGKSLLYTRNESQDFNIMLVKNFH